MRTALAVLAILVAAPASAGCNLGYLCGLAVDSTGALIRGEATPPKVTATSPVSMPTPIYDGPEEDPAVAEARRLRQVVRRLQRDADLARQVVENDRRQDRAWRALDRLHDGLDRDSEALKARRAAERDTSGLITVFGRNGAPSYYIGRSDEVVFNAN